MICESDHARVKEECELAEPEPFVLEVLPRLPKGLVLDVACGTGRHSVLLASVGNRVVAVDNSLAVLAVLHDVAKKLQLPIYPVAADLGRFPLPVDTFDVIVNVNFLCRPLVAELKRALKPGGMLVFDTFLIDQAEIGRPRNPAFLLRHWELREMLADLELLEYREGLASRHDGRRSWRASALAIKPKPRHD